MTGAVEGAAVTRRHSPPETSLFSVPARHNPRLQTLVERIHQDEELRQLWRCANFNQLNRPDLGDAGEVHVHIVANAALKLLRLVREAGHAPAAVARHRLTPEDAEVIVVLAGAVHDLGQAVHGQPSQAALASLVLAERKTRELLSGVYPVRERTIVAAECLHAVMALEPGAACGSLEASLVKLADALDLAKSRGRSIADAAGIEEVHIEKAKAPPVRIVVRLAHLSALEAVEKRLSFKLRGMPLSEVVDSSPAWAISPGLSACRSPFGTARASRRADKCHLNTEEFAVNIPTRRVLDQDLQQIQDDLLRMGSLIDAAITRSLRCLANRDMRLAREIAAEDAQVNALRFKIEEACLTTIATQQPAATDLRMVVATIILASELERMGDYAAGIARTVLRMGDEQLLKPLVDLPRMGEIDREMLREALDAYVARDANKARAAAARDDEVDNLYNQIFREILSYILEDPSTTTRALYLLFSAHNLERIGDRVVNIAERVIFMNSGEMRELNAGPDAPVEASDHGVKRT